RGRSRARKVERAFDILIADTVRANLRLTATRRKLLVEIGRIVAEFNRYRPRQAPIEVDSRARHSMPHDLSSYLERRRRQCDLIRGADVDLHVCQVAADRMALGGRWPRRPMARNLRRVGRAFGFVRRRIAEDLDSILDRRGMFRRLPPPRG